jgi:hypothetical protein
MDVLERNLIDAPVVYLISDLKSENIARDTKGFLVLRDTQIARDGEFIYMGADIYGPDHPLANEKVVVLRPPEEVFSNKTMASVTTAAVTDGHPKEINVNSKNSKYLMKGYVSGNVRKADYLDEFGNSLLICDLVITDEDTIKAIENGKRELSIGYKNVMTTVDNNPLLYRSKDLIINHIAIVPKGRAKTAFIKDEDDIDKVVDVVLGSKIIDIEGGELVDSIEVKKFRHDGEIIEISGDLNDEDAEKLAKDIFAERNKEKEEK